MAPKASSSVWQKIAVGRSPGRASSVSMARSPSTAWQSPGATMWWAATSRPADRTTSSSPADPLLPDALIGFARHPSVEDGQDLVAEPEQMVGDQPPAGPVVDEDARHAGQRRAGGDGGNAGRVGGGAVLLDRDGAGEQQGIAAASGSELAEQFPELRGVDVQIVGVDIEVDQLDSISGRAQDFRGPRGELAEVPGPQRRKHDADRPGMTAGQGRGQLRGGEVQSVGGLDDPLAGRRPHSGDAAEGPGHGALVDPGFASDIGDRGAAHGRVPTGGNDPFSRSDRHGPNYIDPQSFCILATEGKNDAIARRRVIPRRPAPTEGCR